MKWGSAWLDRVDLSGAFSTHTLRRGSEYARYDWQLEAVIEPGRASTIARAGRRMQYEAVAKVPLVPAEYWDPIVEMLAESTRSTAALLDGELPAEIGPPLLPDPNSVTLSCNCHSNDRPCKHAGALIFLLAEAIDDDPFELLNLRGLSRESLVERVTQTRRQQSTVSAEDTAGLSKLDVGIPTGTLTQSDAFSSSGLPSHRGLMPADLPLPAKPGRLPPFPSDPPANAAFTANGLRALADDAAHRALALLKTEGPAHLDLNPTVDFARRAAVAKGTDRWKHLVSQSGVSSQELAARANAWEVAGALGVEVQMAPAEVRRVVDPALGEAVQWRRSVNDEWVRFEKRKGRWEAVEPGTPPEESPG